MSKEVAVKDYLQSPAVRERVNGLLNERSGQFIASVISTVNANESLATCNPATILNAAMTAASLDLPVNSNLGFAYIVPYSDKKLGKVAQFQMGYKGFIQLAQRSGQYQTISATEVYDGQLVAQDPLRGNTYDFTKKDSDTVIGYAALFVLSNGFEKDLYMSKEEVQKHAKRYSQTFKKGFGNWVDDFDAMARKTVIKLLLSRFGPMSVQMQRAIEADQSVLLDGDKHVYADNKIEEPTDAEKEEARVREFIEAADNAEVLKTGCATYIEGLEKGHELIELYEGKLEELS